MEYKEENIISLLKSGNRYGLKILFELYHHHLCVFALRFLDDYAEAEDVVQETFVQFWEKKQFLTVSTSLKSYLFMVVRNRCLRRLEQSKREYYDELENHVDVFRDEIRGGDSLDERIEKLLKEIEGLPDRSREVLTRIIFHGLKYKEVAEDMNISVNSVKTNYSRALQKLRHAMHLLMLFST